MEDERTAVERFRDRVGILERLFERIDERMTGKLGKDDATTLMEHAAEGDRRLREDFVGRLNDTRIEMREAFKHNEKETASAIYKAVTESEGKITNAIAALATTVGAMSTTPQPSPDKRMHPALPLTGGLGGGMAFMYLVLAFLGMVPRPG